MENARRADADDVSPPAAVAGEERESLVPDFAAEDGAAEDPATPPTEVAGSWSELEDLLFAGSWDPSIRRHRPTRAFRGHAQGGVGLASSLTRLGSDYAKKEPHLVRNFRKYAYPLSPGEESVWNWLALAAHHGLPTRLLDWTFSPWVALHFATSRLECVDEDGDIWSVDFRKTNRELPEGLRRTLAEEGTQVFSGEMLARHARSLPELDGLASEPFAIFLEPPSLDDRIVNQAALFSLMSDPVARFDHWLTRHPGVCRRIVLPAGLKWEVRDKLDQANVTERVLFPGLDGLSRWLTRYYTQRP